MGASHLQNSPLEQSSLLLEMQNMNPSSAQSCIPFFLSNGANFKSTLIKNLFPGKASAKLSIRTYTFLCSKKWLTEKDFPVLPCSEILPLSISLLNLIRNFFLCFLQFLKYWKYSLFNSLNTIIPLIFYCNLSFIDLVVWYR